MRIGLDVGSTTLKAVVIDDNGNIVFSSYERHFSEITKKTAELLAKIEAEVIKGKAAMLAISGSAGMGLSTSCKIPFIQEVYATRTAVKKRAPSADIIIELGGEDAKILFMHGGSEVRMNGSCAGGTGAFIDQMATLLKATPEEINELSSRHEKIHTIASRCGVFAKSDIQPLINQGVRKEDIAASILYAVVNQTISGLAQGRRLEGNILYLGGPLTFLSELRNSFDKTLSLTGECPEHSLYFVALGAAYSCDEEINLDDAIAKLQEYKGDGGYSNSDPLFESEAEYNAFLERHSRHTAPKGDLKSAEKLFVGVDAGSTTVKIAVTNEKDELVFSKYQTNSGNPVPIVKDFLSELYSLCGAIPIASAAVTGYGEAIIKNAFNFDYGLVETIAHLTAAQKFMPNVEFVIDIGGQDMKCFKIRGGAIDNIFLNEACSSGCGSFLQTFANALNYDIADFAKLGIYAERPVELGSRCTVFMNSSVKQAQKDGASIENISAGLSISVIKNALYKVIRVASKEDLGKQIVVQGGTFYNDAVLRAFERELDCEVIRPDIAGLMGAYGAALYAKEKHNRTAQNSRIADIESLSAFTSTPKSVRCGLCSNNCTLEVNTFNNGNSFISGNKCERPIKRDAFDDSLNMYEYKRNQLAKYFTSPSDSASFKGKIGMPLALNIYEMLPFWSAFWNALGYQLFVDGFSDRQTYLDGQTTIPSDTICFPAKLVHGQIEALLRANVDAIFYPCMSYNFNEEKGDNHFNCPVVAYYPEVIKGNMSLGDTPFIYDYIKLDNHKLFAKNMTRILSKHFEGITLSAVKYAVESAFGAHRNYQSECYAKGRQVISLARERRKKIIVLAGRPYHIDPEVSHSIDKLVSSLGAAVISEDAIAYEVPKMERNVLNQWTYHARMYGAAEYVCHHDDMNLVQLVSFGCGVDAITSDEVRDILEEHDKIYTQIKIDEITNLGTVKIRLRSLMAALEQRENQ